MLYGGDLITDKLGQYMSLKWIHLTQDLTRPGKSFSGLHHASL